MNIFHIAFFIYLTFSKYIFYMFRDTAALSLEQFCHLCLCQPNGFVFHSDINFCQTILGLIHNDLRLFRMDAVFTDC